MLSSSFQIFWLCPWLHFDQPREHIHCVPKKADHQTHGSNSRFSKFFHCAGWFSSKFAVKCLLKIAPHLKHVATLPCEICVQEIAMLKNCMNKLSHNIQQPAKEVTQCWCKIYPLKIIVKKITRIMIWALFNSLTRRYLLSNPQNNWLNAAAATKKMLRSKILLHISNIHSQSLVVLVSKSKSVYTSLIIV